MFSFSLWAFIVWQLLGFSSITCRTQRWIQRLPDLSYVLQQNRDQWALEFTWKTSVIWSLLPAVYVLAVNFSGLIHLQIWYQHVFRCSAPNPGHYADKLTAMTLAAVCIFFALCSYSSLIHFSHLHIVVILRCSPDYTLEWEMWLIVDLKC